MAFLAAGFVATKGPDRLHEMLTLYDRVCLHDFPNDAAIERGMAASKARPLSSDEVRVTLQNDSGRGWEIASTNGAGLLVILESPPYHACSVRSATGVSSDVGDYRRLAASYEAGQGGGFESIGDQSASMGDVAIHAFGEQRKRADGTTESLFAIEQHFTGTGLPPTNTITSGFRLVHHITSASD